MLIADGPLRERRQDWKASSCKKEENMVNALNGIKHEVENKFPPRKVNLHRLTPDRAQGATAWSARDLWVSRDAARP